MAKGILKGLWGGTGGRVGGDISVCDTSLASVTDRDSVRTLGMQLDISLIVLAGVIRAHNI